MASDEESTAPSVHSKSLSQILNRSSERQIKRLVTRFLDDLIKAAVNYCEFITEEFIIGNNIDKCKLVSDIINKYKQCEMEEKTRIALEKKVVDHYRKKGMTPFISAVHIAPKPEQILRYENALDDLDDRLGRLQETTRITREDVEKVEFDLAAMNDKYTKAVHHWNHLIHSLIRNGEEYYLKQVTTTKLLL